MVIFFDDKNYKILIEYFKENDIKSDPIKEITQKQRELKLKRILEQDNIFSKDDILDAMLFVDNEIDVESKFKEWYE